MLSGLGWRGGEAPPRVLGRSGWLGALALAASLCGCGEPAADVVAVWVDGVSDDRGDRIVRLYAAGERDALRIEPDIPGSSLDLLQIGLDDRGRGVVVSATDATVFIERDSGRRVTLSAAAAGREELVAPGFSFTGNGDAILRALERPPNEPPAWIMATLSGSAGLRVHAIEPPRPADPGRRFVLHHAADAPVLVWAELGGSPSAVDGELLALAYPSEDGEGPVVDELRPLARGTLRARGANPDDPLYLPGCPDQLCVAPSGRVVYAMARGSVCDLLRWSWVEAASSGAETMPEPLEVRCPGDGAARLTAVLDDDVVVMDDPLRIYVLDLQAQTVAALPKPAGFLRVYSVARGRSLVLASSQGEVARVDVEGPRMVSGVQSPCVVRDGFAVSPSGAWVVQSCNGQTGAPSGVDGQIQRISVLGSELYGGVPMRPIAIDDDGNALLYSIASDDDDGVPRGLFVLTGDGQLTRVDSLEPFPGRVMVVGEQGEREPGRFAAAGPA